tara:strand:+ start:53 stop:274 length:222 start_codon:yes stop_codon:yes gene_type:complete
MFAAYKTRKIFLIGAATYEHAKYVCDKKGMDMVLYLRARREINSPASTFINQGRKNKKYSRYQYLLKRRTGII